MASPASPRAPGMERRFNTATGLSRAGSIDAPGLHMPC
eukprot:CAMPEP_0179201980 /NCGR_PEP_ID=MMETSP0796-20121207/100558_1 /TAXON_ID=73915 /ORGANISM="Pyrodinium bahamense, Strain pbaha01" /LENGTH=37 /DNA_ID= /DNA_START= /DNA_END= /DNA_ORIENTATION=